MWVHPFFDQCKIATLMCLSAMMQLHVAHINVVTKMDLFKKDKNEDEVDIEGYS